MRCAHVHCTCSVVRVKFEWRFYALSASKAIFRVRTYSRMIYSVRWTWLLLMMVIVIDEWNYEETYHRDTMPTHFDKWHGTFYMPSRIDSLDITKALMIRQSWTTARSPSNVKPFSHEGRSSATGRIRTHSSQTPADYKRNALPLRPPGTALWSEYCLCHKICNTDRNCAWDVPEDDYT